MNFKANGGEYTLDKNIRDLYVPDWREMLKPSKKRDIVSYPYIQALWLIKAEENLYKIGESLVGKNILEIGCGYGNHCYLMAKYEGTKVHGIDVDEYIVDQSPDLNNWNPEDVKYTHDKLENIRKVLGSKFPEISDKVTFGTCRIEDFVASNQYDVIFSFDVLEHVLNLPLAFERMSSALKKGGIAYHEYNPFFSVNGGHSLCILDFHYGHCRLTKEDFERYIREIRPNEEKIALNFYHKCLNRATIKHVKECAKNSGFEILKIVGESVFKAPENTVRKELEQNILPDVVKIYPDVTVEDLLWSSIHLILRKL